jgi:two-component system, OmpR family, sensor histidine kinase VicK
MRHSTPVAHRITVAKRPHFFGSARLDPRLILAAIVESSDDAIIGETLQGVITSWNAGAERLYGYTAEQMVGRSISRLVPLDRPDELQKILASVTKGERVGHLETKRTHKDGRLIDVSLSVSPIRDAAGNVVGASLIARDITRRKRAEIATSELAAIVDSSDDAIIGKTLDGVITSWNQGAQQIYGYAAEEMVGHSIAVLVPPERPHELEEILGSLMKGRTVKHFETDRVRKDGLLIYVSVTISPIRDPYGTIVGSSSVARDITQEISVRAALKASELRNVQEVIRAKDDVVALVSHELRTPLASIVGFTELLYSRVLSEKQRKSYLGIMLREGRRLTNLINEVLQLQRLENGHQKLYLAPTDVKALLQRVVDNAGVDDRRALGLVVPNALPLVLADADAILQVLANFVSNARKYSPDGGSIHLSARVVKNMVEISIRDHGLGVPAQDLPYLFQRFYRVDSPDRQSIKGTGLGLAINQRIVEAHGGRVGANSEGLGKGSVFQFTLPTAQAGANSSDVLIVDDDIGFARLLEAELLAVGLTAVRAGDAETAEHLLLDGMKPRAVVLDLVLPGMQGGEFLARLAAHNNNSFPTIVLTAQVLGLDEIAILEKAGAAAALPKEAGASEAAVELIVQALTPRL